MRSSRPLHFRKFEEYYSYLVDLLKNIGGKRPEEALQRLARLDCKSPDNKTLESCDAAKKPTSRTKEQKILEQAGIDGASYVPVLRSEWRKTACSGSDANYILDGVTPLRVTVPDEAQIIDFIAEEYCPSFSFLTAQQKIALLENGGSAYQEKGDYVHAIDGFTKAIELDPNDADAYDLRGRAHVDNHDFDSAINDLTKVIALASAPAAYQIRGVVYAYRLGYYGLAIADFTKAIELVPDNAEAYNDRGYVYMGNRDFAHAFADLTKVIELAPSAAAFDNRGDAYSGNGSFNAALADYKEAMKLDPKSASIFDDRGRAYAYKGDYERALADYTDAMKLERKFARAFTDRGDVFAAKQDYGRAITDYNEALKVEPKGAERARAFRHRGAAYAEKNDYGRAIDDYGEAIKLDPTDTYSVLLLYLARARAGDPNADAELNTNEEKLKKQDWPYPIVELLLNHETPEEFLRAAPATPNERCDAQFYLGEWYLLHGDHPKTIEALNAAAATCPKVIAEYRLARAELRRLQP